jgi:uncharacterized protein YndB with AHSA1/START domain
MTTSVVHDTFMLERDYPASAKQVFHAFADLATKRQWFAASDDWEPVGDHTLDFRVGGREHESGRQPNGGPTHTFDAVYHDIVDDERIVYSYTMTLDDRPLSVSLTTIEIERRGNGSRLRLTEHGAYFEGDDAPAMRQEGMADLLDALGRYVATAA